uniref:TdiD protein n=1 Tax=Mycena chlorophos TaxID=658473 RepID=A0ABQ0LSG2_MYCCL|nr:TdiD protein [Mycena chlorophos]
MWLLAAQTPRIAPCSRDRAGRQRDALPVVSSMGSSTTNPQQRRVALPLALESLLESFYADLLSNVAKSRVLSQDNPGVLSLLAGKPNPRVVPVHRLAFTARLPPNANSELATQISVISLPSADLRAVLQYGLTACLPALVEWFSRLQRVVHGREKGEGWTLIIGNGSQDLLAKVRGRVWIRMPRMPTGLLGLMSRFLTQATRSLPPVYAGVIPVFQSAVCEQIEVITDADGITTTALRSSLHDWPTSRKKPRVVHDSRRQPHGRYHDCRAPS